MKKIIILIVVGIAVVLENICLFYLTKFYLEQKNYQNIMQSRQGLVQACENVVISEDLASVLQKMKNYNPSVSMLSGMLNLNYGSMQSEGAGVGFLFDGNYKLTHKACDSAWEPQLQFLNIDQK